MRTTPSAEQVASTRPMCFGANFTSVTDVLLSTRVVLLICIKRDSNQYYLTITQSVNQSILLPANGIYHRALYFTTGDKSQTSLEALLYIFHILSLNKWEEIGWYIHLFQNCNLLFFNWCFMLLSLEL